MWVTFQRGEKQHTISAAVLTSYYNINKQQEWVWGFQNRKENQMFMLQTKVIIWHMLKMKATNNANLQPGAS